MLDTNKYTQYGKFGIDVRGITIHNTNSPMSARELFNYLNNECVTTQGCHFLVDKDEIVSVMPTTWCTWHTGKGNDWAFRYTLAIEICNSQDKEEDYLKAQAKAVNLIKQLLDQYGLSTKDIYFHCDFNHQTYCPHRILQMYKTKENFIREELE